MQLHQAQKQIAKSNKRFRVCCCGRRFGKTTLAVLEMVAKAVAKNDRRIAYIAPTYQQARDIAWAELKKICKPATINVNESRLEIEVRTQEKGTSTIWLRGWESIETLRGQKFDFIVIDEIAMMRNFWMNWQEVIRPTLTDTRGHVMFISTPKGFNHFYDLFNTVDDNFESFHFSSYDNPFLPIEELDEAKKQITEDRFAQEYMAEFKKMEGLVYKEFKREIHTFDELPTTNFVETIAGLDFGYTNPFALIVAKKDYDGRYWLVDEIYKTQQTDDEIAEICSQKARQWGINSFYPDPEAPEKIEQLRRKGLNLREVVKGKDSIVKGINNVRDLLKQGRLKINKNLNSLIWELETYHYPENKNPEGKNDAELPEKKDDHAVDALRYMLSANKPVVENQLNKTVNRKMI